MAAYHDFRSVCQAVIEYLHRRIGFDLWLVTRVEGEQWIILQVDDHGGYGVQPGTVFRWADTFCCEMVRGNGPHIAPRTDCIKIYSDTPMSRAVKIGAYLGYPLMREDGSVFGTLCAIHPAPQPNQIVLEQSLVELLARLMATVLTAELKTLDGKRREERLAAQKFIDPVTDLFDHRGWGMLLAAEEDRCARYGSPACVVIIEVRDGDGDSAGGGDAPAIDEERLRVAAGCITAVTRGNDVVARVGDNSLAVLCVECDRGGSRALVARLNESLAGEQINASIGVAHRAPPLTTLPHAWTTATQSAASRDASP